MQALPPVWLLYTHCLSTITALRTSQTLQFLPFSHLWPLCLYVAQSEHWVKVVVRLLVEGGEHSSTAELVHNHRAQSGERETEKPLLCLCSPSLTSLCFFCILLFSTALECFSGAEHSTLLQVGPALGLFFTVYIVCLSSTFLLSRCSSTCYFLWQLEKLDKSSHLS